MGDYFCCDKRYLKYCSAIFTYDAEVWIFSPASFYSLHRKNKKGKNKGYKKRRYNRNIYVSGILFYDNKYKEYNSFQSVFYNRAYVLIVPFLAWVINKKKPDKYAITGAVLATVGLGFLTIEKGIDFNVWDIAAVCCSFFFAAHMIAIEKYGKDSDPILATVIQFIVTAGIFVLLTGCFKDMIFLFSLE